MDPISVSHLVKDRTDDLRRTADQVRLERSLRPKQAPVAAAAAADVPRSQPARPAETVPRAQPASAQPAEARPSPGNARSTEPRLSPGEAAAGCTAAEHAA